MGVKGADASLRDGLRPPLTPTPDQDGRAQEGAAEKRLALHPPPLRPRPRRPAVTTQTTPQTLTQQFATEYAAGAVPGMLKTIRTASTFNKVILAGAMIVSYAHQASFLAAAGASPFG